MSKTSVKEEQKIRKQQNRKSPVMSCVQEQLHNKFMARVHVSDQLIGKYDVLQKVERSQLAQQFQ